MSERAIFEAALDISDPAERAIFLNRSCGGDADLRQQVEGLLQAHEAAGGFLAAPAAADLAATLPPRPDSASLGAAALVEQAGQISPASTSCLKRLAKAAWAPSGSRSNRSR